jgi:hypothetical protein
LREARIGGAELFADMTDAEIASNLASLAAQNVSVIEADSDLSRMLTDREFAAELELMRRYCKAAHMSRRGDRDLFPADYRRKGACNLGWTWNH